MKYGKNLLGYRGKIYCCLMSIIQRNYVAIEFITIMKVDSGVLKRRMNLEKEYNLLSEPWIKVVDQNNMMQEVSLCDFFHNAHKYKQLAGETVTQDVAVYRILQAIVSTVFYRYDLEGK